MNKRLCLIDGDGLIYMSSKETLEESITNLNDKISNIFEKTESTHYVIFISNSPYFRHSIDPLYKSSRSKYGTPLKWLKTLKAYLREKWYAQSMDLVEADDLVNYWYNWQSFGYGKSTVNSDKEEITIRCNSTIVYKDVEKIICSPDKDLLQSIKGFHFNYSYRLENKEDPSSLIKGWWVETSINSAMNFKFQQLVCGDISDGITGIKGKGIKFFESNPDWDLCNILEWYLKVYGQSQGIFEYQKNYRLLHLLSSDEDFMREIGKLPEFPLINEVPSVKTEEVNLTDINF